MAEVTFDHGAAVDLVMRRLGPGPTLAHCRATEVCMRALAARLGRDAELWGLAGLVHDCDLDECADDLARHALRGAEILREAGAPDELVHAVLAHNDKAPRESLLDKALWVVDPTTGMITAAALIRPSRSTADLTVKSVKKRMKDQRFAAAVDRDQIQACEALLGLSLDEHLGLCLAAMDAIRDELGLGEVPA
ncbi:MAG: HD domain-containing protein [Pseudomonadota bacterium]